MVDFLIENWVLVLAALTSGALLLWPHLQNRGGGAAAVSVSEAVRLMNREKAVLVDISTAAEYAAGHAIGARHVAADQLGGSAQVPGLPTNKGLPVLVMCARGARSGRAVAQLRKAGFEKAFSVEGGLAAWREAQLPVEKSQA